MLEIGKKYKLKKIKAPFTFNDQDVEFKILSKNDNYVVAENVETHEQLVLQPSMFITDPNDDVWGELKPVVECGAAAACCPAATAGSGTGGAMGATAPVPALAQVLATNGAGGVKVNGIPVVGKSNKKKKKKSKKNEDLAFDFLSVEELIEEIENTFDPHGELYGYVEGKRENVVFKVTYTNPEDNALVHTLEVTYSDPITDEILDIDTTEDLTIEDVVSAIRYIAQDCGRPATLREDLINDVEDVLDIEMDRVSNFKERYEEIADYLAKQLDRMNFVYADTEEIIYKKEGAYKYLIKFDNENGILKFKASKDDETIYENEWKLQDGQDIAPIFDEIKDIYAQYGI